MLYVSPISWDISFSPGPVSNLFCIRVQVHCVVLFACTSASPQRVPHRLPTAVLATVRCPAGPTSAQARGRSCACVPRIDLMREAVFSAKQHLAVSFPHSSSLRRSESGQGTIDYLAHWSCATRLALRRTGRLPGRLWSSHCLVSVQKT